MSLESALNTWNGHPDDLQAIYLQFKRQPDFLKHLIPLLKQKQQRGASELLKRYLPNHSPLALEDIKNVFGSFGVIQQWQTQENLLACLPFLHPYPQQKQQALARFIHNALHSPHKSVMALAQESVAHYEQDFPDQPFSQFLSAEEKAMNDGADKTGSAKQQNASLF